MSTLELSKAHRAELRTLTGLAERDLALIWADIDPTDATLVRDALAEILPQLVAMYGSAAATLGADWYDELRLAAEVDGHFTALATTLPDIGRTDALAGWAVGPLFKAEADPSTVLTLASGGLQRIIADADRHTIMESSVADPGARGWERMTNGGCAFCEMIGGRGEVFSEASADFASHDHCLLPGTVVTSGTVDAGYRRWYEGEVIVLRSAAGDEVSITPNHPVLTDRGWVEAGLLREGDDVVQRSGADLASLEVPHEDDMPTLIEQVWRTYSMDGLARVPSTAEDFHGDGIGTQGDIEVVAPDGFFPDVFYAGSRERVAQPVGAGTGAAAVLTSLPTQRNLAHVLVGVGVASSGLMGRPDLLSLPFRCQCGLVKCVRLGDPAPGHSRLRQPTFHRPPLNAVSVGETLLGFAGHVAHGKIRQVRAVHPIGRRAASLGARYDPPPAKSKAQRLRVHAELGRRLRERLAGGIQLSRLSDLRRIDYSGHVYNLRTVEGWFSANNVIVSNCQCTAVPAFGGEPKPVKAYTPGPRVANTFDRARVREYLKTH